MADFDEYDYLEKQLEGGAKANGAADEPKAKEDRPKDRDKERSDKHSSRERDRDGRRDRERDRDGGKRERERSGDGGKRDKRERSRSRERRDRDVDRPRSKSARPRSPPKRRERTPPEVREQREREKELEALDRDTRTVFAYNLPLKADERDIFEFFSQAGKVVDVRIICDRNTRRSKGFAYIEMADRNDIINAISLTGQVLRGQQVMVKMSEAEKNLAWEANQQQAAQQAKLTADTTLSTGPCTLAVSNLLPTLSEADIAPIFEPFGVVMAIRLVRDPAGRSMGYGHVEFASAADATRAMQDLQGMDVAGQKLMLQVAPQGAIQPVAVLPGPPPPMGMAMAPPVQVVDESLGDEEDGGGLKLTSQARASLMSRLANSAGITVPDPAAMFGNVPSMAAQPSGPTVDPALALEQGFLGPASPIPTHCLLLKNMFNPAEESEPNWELDIGEDVKAECSKYGEVVHVFVDKNSKGFVYLKFMSTQGAQAAQQALNGRWFAGRRIAAEFQFAQPYSTHFGV